MKGASEMFHYEYVTRKEAAPYRAEIEAIIHEVQDVLREADLFTFQYSFIGSSARNMITYDPTTNTGFDFDINVEPNDDDCDYSPKELKEELMNTINKVAPRYGFRPCENSTRVITVKKVNRYIGAIEHSFDIAIVNNYLGRNGEKHQQFVKFRKNTGDYLWQEQPKGYDLEPKIEWIKSQEGNLWDDVFDLYLDKKNNNNNPNKKSRALYAETINEICQKNGYYSE